MCFSCFIEGKLEEENGDERGISEWLIRTTKNGCYFFQGEGRKEEGGEGMKMKENGVHDFS